MSAVLFTLVALASQAARAEPHQIYSIETWEADVLHVHLECLVMDLDAGGKESTSAPYPDSRDGELILDAKTASARISELDEFGVSACEETRWTQVHEVKCDNRCACNDTCGADGGWVCRAEDPLVISQFSRETARFVHIDDFECSL